MNEQQIRQIVRDEMERNYRSGSPMVPPHTHDGVNNLQVPLSTTVGVEKLSKAFIDQNTFANSNTSVQELATKGYVFPVPVFSSGHQGSFEKGSAPEGTIIIGNDGALSAYRLWVMFGGEWYYVNLSLY